MKKHILFSFAINIFGLVALFIIDIYMSKTNNIELISSWALTKSVLFIGVLFVLLGMDQAIVRMKLKLQEIFLMVLIQFTIIISFILGILYLLDFKLDVLSIASSMFLLAISYLFYAEYRLNLNYTKAQLFLQGWKIVLFLLLMIIGFTEYSWVLPFSFLILFFIFALKDIKNSLKIEYINWSHYKNSLTTGVHYFSSLLTLTVSLYFDQLLLNYDGKIVESSQLFSHITFFVSPIIIFLGFAGFILGPYLRNNPKKKVIFFKKYFIWYLLIGVVLALNAYFLGSVLFSYFKPNKESIDYLAIGLIIVVFFRYLYILPSAYIGSFASNTLIRNVSTVNALGLLLYVVIYFFISRFYENHLTAILLAMLVVWGIRIINGYYAIYKILKEKDTNG